MIGRGWDESGGSRERFFNGLGHLPPPKMKVDFSFVFIVFIDFLISDNPIKSV